VVTARRVRRRLKLLDDLKERRGYFHLKVEAIDRAMWGARFGRGFGPVVKQSTKLIQITHQLDATISPVYYLDVYLQLNMFRASPCPSSGAQ